MTRSIKPTSFGEKLIAAGALTQPQLDLALREQKRKGGLLGQILVQLEFVKPEVLSEVLAREAEAETINLHRLPIDQSVLKLVPIELARRFRAVPVSRKDHSLTVALADPFNVVAIDTLHQVTGLNIEVATAPERDILNCLDLYYRTGDTIDESIDKILEEK